MTAAAVSFCPVPVLPDIEWVDALVLVRDDALDGNAVVVTTGARIERSVASLRRAGAELAARTRAPFLRARHRYVVAIGQDRGYNPRVSSLVERRVGLDAYARQFREPVTLHIPWSWPPLPMWLAVTEHSATTATVSLELRSRRRVRYPYRYFSAAHAALDAMAAVGCARRD
jgi:hypothetical protein